MNNIISNFPQIVRSAIQLGLPGTKQRGIIREYLQCKFIHDLYQEGSLTHLSFVGGTSLRLLRNLPRFSEDLDFDNLGLSSGEIAILIQAVIKKWQRENITVELVEQVKGEEHYTELRFPTLLHALKISSNPREKLMIKLDYASWWHGQRPEVLLLNRFGFLEQITTNPLNQLLVQKLTAYVRRHQTQPRDLYDVAWLYAQGARLDSAFIEVNNLHTIPAEAISKLKAEGIPASFTQRLAPFLFDEVEVNKLHLFSEVCQALEREYAGDPDKTSE